jgi:hypothetical protein
MEVVNTKTPDKIENMLTIAGYTMIKLKMLISMVASV